jgi:hypothetical protein
LQQLGDGLAVFKPVGQGTERERLDASDGIRPTHAVSHHAGRAAASTARRSATSFRLVIGIRPAPAASRAARV